MTLPDSAPDAGADVEARGEGPWFAAILLFAGFVFGALGVAVPAHSFNQPDDPGPRWFPWTLAALILAGGVWEAAVWWRGRGGARRMAALGSRPAWFFLAGLILYTMALPYAGFRLATLLLAVTMMRTQGVGWRMALATALGALIVVELLFVRLFHVPLPEGLWRS